MISFRKFEISRSTNFAILGKAQAALNRLQSLKAPRAASYEK